MNVDLTTRGTPRRRLPREQRREQLLDVAESLFIERGYSGVSMEDICGAAGVSRPVLYNHFGSREGVYLACVRRAREQLDLGLIASADLTAEPREVLRQGASVFFGMLESDPGRWRLIFGGTAVLPESHAADLAELRFETIRAIENVLRQVAPRLSPLDAKMAASSMSGVGERLGLLWLREPELSLEQIIEHYVDILWAGLRDKI